LTELPPFELGFRGTELRRDLVAAVLHGDKVATASLREEYWPATEEPMPESGERFILLGYDDEPLGIIETTDVRVVRAADVDLQFARDEGEGFKTVAQWRAAHERFWIERKITDDTLIVCERFSLVVRY
jgi:uncharacterized protein YhfF